ncbi:MAG: RNA polymerase factor sigma-54 [Alphaproteobacteria bacterium]
MALTPKLDLRQSQALVMTPQLQQAIKLLQMSNLELAVYVESELEQNPLLERAEADDAPGAGTAEEATGAAATTPTKQATGATDPLPGLDANYDNLWSSDGAGEGGGAAPHETWQIGGAVDAGYSLVEQTPAGEIGLRDHLLNQLNVDIVDPVDRVIGVHLIDMLDDAGYLSDDLTPVAQLLGCHVARVEATLAKLHNFDPPGIFARSLRECLALQLSERDRLDPAMEVLLDNLDLLADHENEELQRRCGVDDEDFVEMLAEIRALNPKPGLTFDKEVARTIVPDVFVRTSSDGNWNVELNNDTLPRVLVNRRYFATVNRQARTKEEREYLAERLTSANWLVKSLDQRANTILRVSIELIRQQSPFLTRGVRYLRPLIMRDIADAIDMHESTVSRVTANKYIATPRGIYEMRYFFTNAIPSTRSHTEAHSSEAVRYRVKALIEAEDASDVLSDDRLVAILKGDGVDIARRTVAKYREAMRIPSSIERRRQKRRRH